MVRFKLSHFVLSFFITVGLSIKSLTVYGVEQEFCPHWKKLQNGICYIDTLAPEKSILNDSKLFILKIDPNKCSFSLLCSSETKGGNLTAPQWAINFKETIIVNAGMFNMANQRVNKGYLKNYKHLNNPQLNKSYNVMMAMNPIRDSDKSMIISDMTMGKWENIRLNYNSLCQGMRMIDGNGAPLNWDKRPGQSCSMVIGATDLAGNIYFAFTRSPYTHQQMINFMLQIIPAIRTTVYLEGGPEASVYIQTGDTIISKYGSYVSKTFANDANDHFWKLPNVIGIHPK